MSFKQDLKSPTSNKPVAHTTMLKETQKIYAEKLYTEVIIYMTIYTHFSRNLGRTEALRFLSLCLI